MSYNIEIADSAPYKIEISSSVNEQTPIVQILQNQTKELSVSNNIALLPSDFNDNVKSIIGSFLNQGYGVSIASSGSFLVISASGLQPSGNYSIVGHSHIATDITDFISSVSGLLPVKNIISGSGINIVDTNGSFTVAVTGQFGLTGEQVDDRVNNLLSTGYGINLNYDDNNNLLTISTIGLQPSGNYSVVGHSHVAADISDFVSAASGAAPVQTVAGRIGNIVLTKSDLGLNNVDNTSDINKPISSSVQTALNLKSNIGHTHTSSNITDFSSSVSGLLPVKNILSGSGISVTSSGSDFTVAVTGQFGLTGEQVDDRVSNLLVPGNYVNLNYNDSNDSLAISVTGLQPSGNYSIAGHSHVISDVSGLQSVLDSKQPSGNYANSIHSHTSSDITDFNFSVSGLLPVKNIVGSGYVNISSSSGNFTVSVSGLQPSGNYANSIHTHTSNDITDFNSSVSGLLTPYATVNSPNFSGVPTAPTASSGTNNSQIANTQFVRTEISNLVNAAPSTLDTLNELATALGNDPNFATTITNNLANKANLSGANFSGAVSGPSGDFGVLKQSGVVVSVSGHSHLYTDISNFASGVSDNLTTTLLPGSFINLDYNSTLDTLTISTSGLQPSGNYSVVGHTHTSSNITDFNSSVSGLLPTVANSGSNRLLTSTGSNVGVSAQANLTFNGSLLSVTGSGVFSSGLNIANQTASTIASFDNNKNIISLPTGTYPSLNELAYVKGVTSSLQTQLDNKAALSHTHSSSQITDFNNSVSGLLPVKNVAGSGYVGVSSVSGTYTVSVTGLQPSGNYSLVGHTHISSNITDFNTSVSGLIDGIYAPLSGSLNQFASTSSDQLRSIISDETGTGSLVFSNNPVISGVTINGNLTVSGSGLVASNINNFDSQVRTSSLDKMSAPINDVSFNSRKITNLADPTENQDAATKAYVDAARSGLDVKQSVKVASTIGKIMVGFAAGQTVDGYTLVEGDRILLKDQSPLSQNGIYVVRAAGLSPIRASDADTNDKVTPGMFTFVEQGTVNADSGWVLTTNGTITLGTTDLSFAQFSGAGQITAGSGMTKTGNTLDIGTASSSRIVVNADNIDLATVTQSNPSGSAGVNFVQSATIDSYGRVTGVTTADVRDATTSVKGVASFDSGDFSVSGGVVSVKTSGIDNNQLVNSSLIIGSTNISLGNTTTNLSGLNNLISSSGQFNSLTVNNINVSVSGHSHTASNITDFNSSVSGLLPSISGSTYITSSFNNNIYTISTTGLQPSGNYSLVGHTHLSSDVTDFNSSVSGLLPTISNSGDNRILTSTGSNVGINAENNLTFDGSLLNVTGSGVFTNNVTASGFVRSGGTSSQFLKADGSIDSSSYYLNSNPSGYTTNIGTVTSVAALTVGSSGTDISSSIENSTSTPVITLNIPSASASNRGLLTSSDWTTFNNKQPSGNYSTVGHTHSSSDITNFNSSVSGLLPVTNILGGSNITVSQSGTTYTVAVTGSLGLTTEEVDDRVASLLVAGSGINLNYNDPANSLTISVSGLSSSATIGNGSSGVINYDLSQALNIVGSGSTSINYNNTSKTVTVSSPSLIRESELISSSKSTFTVTGGYALNNLDVYHNGIKLLTGGDYTATNGTSFSLVQPAVSGDVVEWLGYSIVPRSQLILGEVRSDTVSNINYLGRAVAGTSESSNVWTIKRYTIAANGSDITTATASNVSWNNRLSATYV